MPNLQEAWDAVYGVLPTGWDVSGLYGKQGLWTAEAEPTTPNAIGGFRRITRAAPSGQRQRKRWQAQGETPVEALEQLAELVRVQDLANMFRPGATIVDWARLGRIEDGMKNPLSKFDRTGERRA